MTPAFPTVPRLVETAIIADHHVVRVRRIEDDLVMIHVNAPSLKALEGDSIVLSTLDVHIHRADPSRVVGIGEEFTVVLGVHHDVVALPGPALAIVGRPEEPALLILCGHQGIDNA